MKADYTVETIGIENPILIVVNNLFAFNRVLNSRYSDLEIGMIGVRKGDYQIVGIWKIKKADN